MNDWFEWKGQRCTDLGIHVTKQPDITLPKERVKTETVFGRSGTLTKLEGDTVFEEMILNAECCLDDTYNLSAVCAYLRGGSSAMFANRPTGYYEARGNDVTLTHDVNTGTLSNTTLPNGQQTAYQYDSVHRLTSVQASVNGGTVKNEYTYSDAFEGIETIRHNTTSASSDVQYTFGVNVYGDPTTTKVGTQTLSTNVYTSDAKHQLTRTEFGNGGKIEYVYDSFDRVIGIKLDNDTDIRFGYIFGANGQATKTYDNHLGETVRTEHDLAERISKVQVEDEAHYGHSLRMTYDDYNNVSSIKERIGVLESEAASEYETTYVYDADNRPTTVQFGAATRKVANTYDALGRVSVRNFTYTYDAQTSDITVVRHSSGERYIYIRNLQGGYRRTA